MNDFRGGMLDMLEYGFSLTRIFQHKDRIFDSVLLYGKIWVRENSYCSIFYALLNILCNFIANFNWNILACFK